jgi:ATP-dependent helicase/nuclease subunit B
MSLELLLSPPGTGKTTHCIELFKNEILKSNGGIDSRAFFILPSREHADRIQNVILRKGVAGLFNAHILTINDFTSRLLGASAGAHPSDAVRRAVLKSILEDSDLKFEYFEEVRRFKGFQRLLIDSIKEFKSNLVSIKEFEKLAQGLLKDPVFRAKFRDFSIVLKNYENRLEELGLKEAEEDIEKLVEESSAGGMDLVIFDGFYHFNRAQKHLIEAVSGWAKNVVVTLTMPEDEKDRPALFQYPKHTRDFLLEIGFKQIKNQFLTNHRTTNPAIRHLAANVFSDSPKKFTQTVSNISIIEAPSVAIEIEMIAREIRRLYRETPAHFSDICVLFRSITGYEKVLRSVFQDYEIPIYIHERKKLIESGSAVTLYRFFNLIRENWRKRRPDLCFKIQLLGRTCESG